MIRILLWLILFEPCWPVGLLQWPPQTEQLLRHLPATIQGILRDTQDGEIDP